MAAPALYAVVLAGGSGTRFWPASRAARPKQYLPVAGGRALLLETWERLAGLVPPERVLVVTAESQAELVRATLPELPPDNLIAEPIGRNTGPCIALAARIVAQRDPDAIQAVLPADHLIAPASAFRATLAAAAQEAAREACLLTFGIRPTYAATGYGYIEVGEQLHTSAGVPVHAVRRFVEKPGLDVARDYLATGAYLWNAGIFVWSTAAILAAVRTHMPATDAALADVALGRRSIADVYPGLTSEPIDIAVLERADNVRTLPIDYGWSDVGSWAALFDLTPADEAGNRRVLSGGAQLAALDARDNLVFAEGRELVALLGVSDLVVVRAGNATLVCPRDRAEEVKQLVERLRTEGAEFL